jgi:hypothetical protein
MKRLTKDDLKYFVPVFAAFAFTLSLSLWYNAPIGDDIKFHLKVAESWARGELGMFSAEALSMNRLPYPPLFHLLLMPSVWLGIEIPFAAFLQILLFPAAVLSLELLFWRQGMKFESLLAGALVLGSHAFFDRAVQVAPQALDMILLPFAIYGVVSKKRNCLVVSSTLMIYNHGFVALAILGGLFLFEILRRNYRPVLTALALVAPILLVSLPYLPQSLSFFGGKYENSQEAQFWFNPLYFTVMYQRLLFTGFFVPFSYFSRGIINVLEGWADIGLKYFWMKWTDMEKASLLTLGSMAVMVLPWADRFTQYSTIPLTVFLVGMIMRSKPRIRDAWQYLIVISALLFYATIWIWLFANQFAV